MPLEAVSISNHGATNMTAPAAIQQSLTQEELAQGRLFLQQTLNAVIGATKGLSHAQWTFTPGPDRWSIAQNLDHIVTVQEFVLGPVLAQLCAAPAPPATFDRDAVDAIVIHQVSTRLQKFPAPEAVLPNDQINPQQLLNRLADNYARLQERLESTPGLRDHAIPSAPVKAISGGAHELMDAYQWILAAGAHSERHAKQILEVIADPAYPV
jgi:hypothetical protein